MNFEILKKKKIMRKMLSIPKTLEEGMKLSLTTETFY